MSDINNTSNTDESDTGNLNKISRRDFLKFLAAGASVLAIGGLGGFANLLGPNNNRSVPLPKASAQQVGSWTMAFNTAIPAIHIALLHTGKVLYGVGSGWDYNKQLGPYQCRIRDMSTGAENTLTQSEDLFCCGQTTLADGTILLAGGTAQYDTNPDNCNGSWHGASIAYELDPSSETMTKLQNMLHGRWYPTLITLPDGRVWCYNGYDEYGINNRLVERYDPSTKTWTRIGSPSNGLTYTVGVGYENTCPGPHPTYTDAGPTTSFYPRAHMMPSGLVVINGFRPEIRSWNPTTGAWGSHGNTGVTRHYGTSFLLPLQNATAEKGKILVCGGSSSSETISTTNAQILDFNTGNPTIRTISSTRFARKYMSPVILPDGKCVIFGGTESGNVNPVLAPEMFDPVTETWQTLPASTIPRYYHSVGLLLPDGRVWIAGGTRVSSTFESRSEFFSPSYTTATRPTISGTPTVGVYGGTITIPTPSPTTITEVSLLRLMNTTHHYDPNQRLVWLQIQSRETSSITVGAPINANLAPPGYYMVHVLDNGIPSIGSIIRIPGTSTAPPTGDTTLPTLAITSPANGSTHPAGTVAVSGTASDNVGVSDVRVSVDSGAYQTATTTNNWSNWTINLSITTTGAHRITANARDAANNFVTREIDITIGSIADTIVPTLAITSPANGSTHPAGTVTISGTASDNVGVRDVRVRVDSGAYQTATTTDNWANWTINLPITATGAHRITANARDVANNFVTRGIDITIGSTADTTVPSVAITAPANGSSHPANTDILVQGTASDNVGIRDVRVRVDSGSYQRAATTNSWANWSRTETIRTTGTHRITVNARDAAGNFRTTGIDVNVT
jgi:hypothetical protein